MQRLDIFLGILIVATVAGCDALPPVETAQLKEPPYAAFEYAPARPSVGQAVRFEAQTQTPAPEFSRPEMFEWMFGDGATAQGETATHAFDEANTYTVTLTTRNAQGLESSFTKTLRIDAETNTLTPAFPYTFGAGLYRVGQDIEATTYRTQSSGKDCFWERLSELDGYQDQIIAREFNDGPAVVQVKGRDRAFNSQGCARWTKDLSPITEDLNAPFGQGVYIVGVDIAPGLWQSQDSGRCYWKRLGGFSWEPADILEEAFVRETPAVVLIEAGDKGFASSECGTWHPFEFN